MAQKVQIVLEDDIDGGNADETVTFGLDGVTYEIDLSHANAANLRNALALYVGSGRKVARTAGRPARGRSRAAADGEIAVIRAWAKQHGHPVSERGRISADVRKAYDAAH